MSARRPHGSTRQDLGPPMRLPAFGRELLELRRRGLVPDQVVVIALDSWRWGKRFTRLVVPPELDPTTTDFSMLAGIGVVMCWSVTLTTVVRRDIAISAIARYRPTSFQVVDMVAPSESFWVISRLRGIERPEYFT